MTHPERLMWSRLRRKQIHGVKFRRQHRLFGYIVDFYARRPRLVIEIDGRSHDNAEQYAYDRKRQARLEADGLTVLRFRNDAVLEDVDRVARQIAYWLEDHGHV
jgi:very-short-patch-repair endonuclease